MIVRLEIDGPYDFEGTLRAHRFGRSDPTMDLSGDRMSKLTRASMGGWVSIRAKRLDSHLEVELNGPGSEAAEPGLRAFFGLDCVTDWEPDHRRLRVLAAKQRGIRLVRAFDLFEAHVIAIFQRRVTYADAIRSSAALHRRFAEPIEGLSLPLDPKAWRALPSYEARAAGVDRHRYEAIQAASRAAHRTRQCETPQQLRALFEHIPGSGPWTTEMVAAFALADADAVPPGDVNLPRQVAELFGDTERPSDERMLVLLEPFRPHRFRVIRLAVSARGK